MCLRSRDLLQSVFGEPNALAGHASVAELLRKGNSAELAGHETVNQEQRSQYVRHKSNGVPAIQRDGQSVLGICDQNWDFANRLCALLNELGHMPALLLTENGRKWFTAMDGAFRRKVQHA